MAHIFGAGSSPLSWWLALVALAALALVVENRIVAGPRQRSEHRHQHPGRAVCGLLCIVALSAAMLPSSTAQPQDALLPDLISDPPRPASFKELATADGSTRLVITFDGYVHNIGAGALDVVGNPQLPGGMKQRVQDGDEWVEIGAPTVRYETEDGHNHFHLIEAIEYVLWNELQGAQTAIGSKIGFCLVDSEQIEPGLERAYSEEKDNFCEEGNPGTTSLRMGITPGWRDIYDATTTLQWVDVSNVAPGRYWIGAITDPNNEIVESNEDNNGLVFSERTVAIPGYQPRVQPPITVSNEPAVIELATVPHGTVGEPVYVVEQAPAHGSIDVPVGASFTTGQLTFTPDPGFVGDDELVFSVRDATSPYPTTSPTGTLALQVDAGTSNDAATTEPNEPPPSIVAPSTFFETTVGERLHVEIQATTATGDPAPVFATGLPAGLVVNTATGILSGVALETGIFEVNLLSTPNGQGSTGVTVIVNAGSEQGGLAQAADRSTPRGAPVEIRVGKPGLGLQFSADGLPGGVEIDETDPVLRGSPERLGTYSVTLRQLDGEDVVAETMFTWTIRPTVEISFAL